MFKEIFQDEKGMRLESAPGLPDPRIVLYYFIPHKDEKMLTASTGGHIAIEIVNGNQNVYFSAVPGKDKETAPTTGQTLLNSIAKNLGLPKLIKKKGEFNEKKCDLSRVLAGRSVLIREDLPKDLEPHKGKFIYVDPKLYFINSDKAEQKKAIAHVVPIDFISKFRRDIDALKNANRASDLILKPDEIKKLITLNGGFVPPAYVGYKKVVLDGTVFDVSKMLEKINEYKEKGYEYSFWQNNCADMAFDVLKCGGIEEIARKTETPLHSFLKFVLPSHFFDSMEKMAESIKNNLIGSFIKAKTSTQTPDPKNGLFNTLTPQEQRKKLYFEIKEKQEENTKIAQGIEDLKKEFENFRRRLETIDRLKDKNIFAIPSLQQKALSLLSQIDKQEKNLGENEKIIVSTREMLQSLAQNSATGEKKFHEREYKSKESFSFLNYFKSHVEPPSSSPVASV